MIELTTLPGGVRLVCEPLSHVRSASLGIWVGSGSRFEPDRLSGVSHCIEHMLFKGTAHRSAGDIARQMDAIGGHLNAFTSKECTCYFLKCLDSHLDTGVDTLCDMFFGSVFPEEELSKEKGVIGEEIGMYEDSPEDLANEKLLEACFEGSGLGRPILGTKDTLEGLNSQTLKDYVARCYSPERIVVSLCGSYDEGQLARLKERFGAMKPSGHGLTDTGRYQPRFVTRVKDYEQNHLCLGFPGLAMTDERRFALSLLTTLLGGGMSSRLFQAVREEKGLCYSIYAYHSAYRETGMFSIYTALGQQTQRQALRLIAQQVRQLCQQGPTQQELDRVRELTKANLLMGLESTDARMNAMGKSTLVRGAPQDMDEVARRYDAVTCDDVTQLARQIFDWQQVSLCAVGQVDEAETYQDCWK